MFYERPRPCGAEKNADATGGPAEKGRRARVRQGGRMSEKDAGLLNPLQLAYLGDTVWETLIRRELICRRLNVHHMHVACVRYVSAKGQAAGLKILEPTLTEAEKEIVRRGRNAHVHAIPKNASRSQYGKATGLEALFGWLYLRGELERINQLFDAIVTKEEG